MNLLSEAVVELRLLVAHAEDMVPGSGATHGHREDFRTEVIADLLELMDKLDNGLGTRLHLALYPQADAQRGHG